VPERVWAGAPHHAFRKGFRAGCCEPGRRRMRSTTCKGTSSRGVGAGTRRAVQQPMVAYDLESVVMRVPKSSCAHLNCAIPV